MKPIFHSAHRFFIRIFLFFPFFLLAFFGFNANAKEDSITPKVVIISMFEIGDYRGDFPGEAQAWIEGENLSTEVKIKGLRHPFFFNKKTKIGLIITDESTANAAASVMAMGLSSRLNLKKTFFIVAGVAGSAPDVASLGSVVMADWAVDADLSHQAAKEELPKSYPFPIFPYKCDVGLKTPNFCEHTATYQVFKLNEKLLQKAFNLTKSMKLQDGDIAKRYRKQFSESVAKRKPFVTIGANLAGGNFWHGPTFEKWAKWWVQKWTKGKAHYGTTAMEETGTLESMNRLSKDGLVSKGSVLVLRSVSNYDKPKPNQSVLESLKEHSGGYPLAQRNVYLVGKKIAHDMLEHPKDWGATLPR